LAFAAAACVASTLNLDGRTPVQPLIWMSWLPLHHLCAVLWSHVCRAQPAPTRFAAPLGSLESLASSCTETTLPGAPVSPASPSMAQHLTS
jgi:hypothetical protein